MFSENTKNHLTELRFRLIYSLISYMVLFTIFFYNSDNIFNLLSAPLLKFLPTNSSLVATQVTTPVIMPLKLAMNLAFFANIPIIFYQLWQFIAPGLFASEKKYILPLVTTSISLFSIGILFSYYFVLPLMFSLFIAWLPSNVAIMADINNHLEFVFNLFIIFGLIFQIPLIIIILIKFNIVSLQKFINLRPYFIIAAFIISMILTPPDVLSMILLAIPICLLFEAGILLARISKQ